MIEIRIVLDIEVRNLADEVAITADQERVSTNRTIGKGEAARTRINAHFASAGLTSIQVAATMMGVSRNTLANALISLNPGMSPPQAWRQMYDDWEAAETA